MKKRRISKFKGTWIYLTGSNGMWVFSKRTLDICKKRGWDDIPF